MRGALVLAALLVASPARARTARDLPYGYDQTWPALVRFLRVDENLKVVEKDEGAGYVLFDLVDGKRTFRGAAELSKLERGTRLVIRVTDRPAYMEAAMMDRFADKLHDELGEPPPAAPPATQPAPPPPGSDDKSEDKKDD